MIFKQVLFGLALLSALCLGVSVSAHAADPHGEPAADGHPTEAGEHGAPGEGGHGEEVNTNPLEFKKDLALWTAAVFVILLAVLWKFAWGPIAQGLQRREQGVADQIAQAEQSNQEAKDLLAQYEQKLTDSKDEVRGILDQGRRDAEQVGREMLDKAKSEAQAEQQRAVQEIDLATAKALKGLADQSATLAVDLAGKIVRAELKPDDHAQLIQRAVAGFGEKTPSNN